ncbi:MAG: aminoglycoside phosphotransferase family protein [Allobranchiibius sp.]
MSTSAGDIPVTFSASMGGRPAADGPDGATWLAALPRLIDECVDQWGLVLDGTPTHGQCALVIPCRWQGQDVVLKVTWPHPEARFEHLALRRWNGRGAVQLVAADPTRSALLLERLDRSRDLHALPIMQACAALGGLYRELDAAPVARVADLPTEAARWARECRAGSPRVPRRMTEQAASLLRDLGPGSREDLVHTDLHYANALAAQRAPWLAIDPKPINGEWEFAVAPALWNRWEEALQADSVRAHLRTRLEIVCDVAGLDRDRARGWSFVRLVLNALWEAKKTLPDQDALSCYISAAKAMQE